MHDMITLKALSSDKDVGTSTFLASTPGENRRGDWVRQDWRLSAFRSNPVILDSHNPARVVGRALSVKVPKVGEHAGNLLLDVEWDLNSPDPSVANVGSQHLRGFRGAVSVGFVPGKRTPRDKLSEDHEAFAPKRKVKTFFGEIEVSAGFLLEKNELYEVSSVAIPADPRALQINAAEAGGDFDILNAVLTALRENPAYRLSFAEALGLDTPRPPALRLLGDGLDFLYSTSEADNG